MPRASIDLGSNSVLLLVVDDDGVTVVDATRVARLGRGLGERGFLQADRMDAAVEALADYAVVAQAHGVPPPEVRVAGTSAMRRALNAAAFRERVRAETGLEIRVISGEDEARLTALGALQGLDLPAGPLVLGDPGGGSTEILEVHHRTGRAPEVRTARSLEVGTVRITEACLAEEPLKPAAVARARERVAAAFAHVHLEPRPLDVVAVAGTATALASAEAGQSTYDGGALHGAVLRLDRLAAWVDLLRGTSPAGRRALVPATPDYADTLLAGTLILERFLLTARRTRLTVSARGLRYGLLAGSTGRREPHAGKESG